jgi:ribosomal protein S27E
MTGSAIVFAGAGRTLYRECPDCRTRTVFFVNPTAP